MRDELKPDEADEPVEDLDVPVDQGDQVKGGDDKKASPLLAQACATGQHIKKVEIHI